MTRSFDSVVLGSDPDGLIAAIGLARAGRDVLLLEADRALGGTFREIEFARGFKAAPLARDVGYLSPEVARTLGAVPARVDVSGPTITALGGEDGPLELHGPIHQTAAVLERYSRNDARRWPAFARRVHAFAGFLETLYRVPPPDSGPESLGDYLELLRLGRKFRGLGRSEMAELLRTLPMTLADLLDDWFESRALKGALSALGVMDTSQGPLAGGTAFTFLHRHVGAEPGVFGERLRLEGGPAALIAALERQALSLRIAIEAGSTAREIVLRDDRVAGIVLESGEEVACREVVSALDPVHSLLELVDPARLDPEFIRAVRNIRFRGVSTQVLVALDSLPSLPAASRPGGAFLIAPSIDYVERASDAAKYGRASQAPFIEIRFPSATQAGLAPVGKHVAVLHVQYTPYRLREGTWTREAERVADEAFALVDLHIPGFSSRAISRLVLTPPELESRFGLREGALSRGEMMLDQILFMRPVAGWSRYAAPVPGLFLCGAGTHPGVGTTGVSGHLAARAVQKAGRP